MKVFVCAVCGFAYNEATAEQDAAGNLILFSQLDSDWICPNCGVGPEFFNELSNGENPDDFSL